MVCSQFYENSHSLFKMELIIQLWILHNPDTHKNHAIRSVP